MAERSASDRERAMIEAYKAGKKITAIQEQFDVNRSTLYHILWRSGIKPSRSHRQVEAASGDARLAGLAELIQHQDQLLQEGAERERKMAREIATLKGRLARLNGSKTG